MVNTIVHLGSPGTSHWLVYRLPKCTDEIFASLHLMIPDDAVACFEDGEHSQSIRAFMEEHEVVSDVSRNNCSHLSKALRLICGRSRFNWICLNTDVLSALAQLMDSHAEPELCEHLHVFMGRQIVLDWYDFPYDPIYVSAEVSERQVKYFCEIVGCMYKLEVVDNE